MATPRMRRKPIEAGPVVSVARVPGFLTGWYQRADGTGKVHFVSAIPGTQAMGVALCEAIVGTTRPLAGLSATHRLVPAEVPGGADRCAICWRFLINSGGNDAD